MVDIVDIVVLVNTVLNNNELQICQILSSDMDFNNVLNVSDIVSLINIILNS